MTRFRPIDRETAYLLPPSIQDWLPEAHLARYVAEVVEGLDLSELERAYAGKGSAPYHPATLLSLLIYGYATGTYPHHRRAVFIKRGESHEIGIFRHFRQRLALSPNAK